MTSVDHEHDSRFRQTSSKAANGDVVQIVTNGTCLAFLDQRFRCPVAKGRYGLGPVPRHGLLFATSPLRYPADDFQHLTHAALRPWRSIACCLVERLPRKT